MDIESFQQEYYKRGWKDAETHARARILSLLENPSEEMITKAAIAAEKAALDMGRNTSDIPFVNARNMTTVLVNAALSAIAKHVRGE